MVSRYVTVVLCNAALTMANRGHQNAKTDLSAQKNILSTSRFDLFS